MINLISAAITLKVISGVIGAAPYMEIDVIVFTKEVGSSMSLLGNRRVM